MLRILKNQTLNLQNIFFKNIFKFIFLLIILLFIWFKFIHERLPRDIPFNLVFLKLILLIIICFYLTYNIISYFFIKKDKSEKIKIIIEYLKNHCLFLDAELKNTSFIKSLYKKKSVKNVELLLKYYHQLLIIEIILKSIMASLFVYDVLISHKIFLTYKFIWLLLYIYVIKYMRFSLESLKQNRCNYINERCYITLTNNRISIALDDFLHIQTLKTINKEKLLDYISVIKIEFIEKMRLQLNLQSHQTIDGRILGKNLRGVIIFILQINQILYLNQQLQNKYKLISLLILINYLICWNYILITSLHTLDICKLIIVLNETWLTLQDPFTDDGLLHSNNEIIERGPESLNLVDDVHVQKQKIMENNESFDSNKKVEDINNVPDSSFKVD